MNEEIIGMGMFPKESRVSTSSQVCHTHVIQLYEDITHPSEYREELNLINNASDMDTIVLDICTDGGVMDTAMLFKRALFNTTAHTVAIIGPSCSSAGSIIALSCKEHVLDDTSNLMIHTSTYGLVAKDTDIFEHANFSRKQLRKLYEDVYSGFLSLEDLEDVIKGTPFYFDADDIAERLEKMYAYRANKIEELFGEGEDFDDEPEFNLIELIEQKTEDAVTKALDKILKKYNLVEKEKPVRKAPAKKSADKVVDKPSPEA